MKNIRFSQTRMVITNRFIHCRGTAYNIISEEMLFIREGTVYIGFYSETIKAEEKTR